MPIDPTIFEKYKSFGDYQRAEDEFQLKKQIAAQTAELYKSGLKAPAAMQLANEYQARIAAGDIEGANALAQFAKIYDKGLVTDGTQVQQLAGYAPAVAGIEGAKAGAKQQAEKNVDIVMNPQIKEREAYSGEIGKQLGETASDLNAGEAAMPQLESAVKTLSDLGKKATYTYAGQAKNIAVRQAGLPVGEGAQARAAYIAHVKNNVLPLLRRTFGAQFTKAEGDSLLATLGDPNASPEEKDATLNAFIIDKKATLETMRRQSGGLNSPQGGEVPLISEPPAGATLYGTSGGKRVFKMPDGSFIMEQ